MSFSIVSSSSANVVVMHRRPLIPLQIAIDAEQVRSETRVSGAGPYALVLSTVFPVHAIELHSTYLGHAGAPTCVSHLLLAPGMAESEAIQHSEESMPVMVARRRCLYDHLQRLQGFLERLGYAVQISLYDDALLAVEL